MGGGGVPLTSRIALISVLICNLVKALALISSVRS